MEEVREVLESGMVVPEPERLEEGQRVKAKQRGTAFFMPARVIRARHNDTYDLMFGGGLKEYAIPRQLMATGDYPVVRGSACPSGTEYISECLRTYANQRAPGPRPAKGNGLRLLLVGGEGGPCVCCGVSDSDHSARLERI